VGGKLRKEARYAHSRYAVRCHVMVRQTNEGVRSAGASGGMFARPVCAHVACASTVTSGMRVVWVCVRACKGNVAAEHQVER